MSGRKSRVFRAPDVNDKFWVAVRRNGSWELFTTWRKAMDWVLSR